MTSSLLQLANTSIQELYALRFCYGPSTGLDEGRSMVRPSKSSPQDTNQRTSRFSRIWRRLRSKPTLAQGNSRAGAQEHATPNASSSLIPYAEGGGSSTSNCPPRVNQRVSLLERYPRARSFPVETQQQGASARLTGSECPSQKREGRLQVRLLQGENSLLLAQNRPAEAGRPLRDLERRRRNHLQPPLPANDSDAAKSAYDVLLKWLTAKESQHTIVLLGMTGIATTGIVAYLASGNICLAAAEIAKVVSVNGSEAVVGVAKVAAPALACMGAQMYIGTQAIWEVTDILRGYILGPSAKASNSARLFGRDLGKDPPPQVRGLPSPPGRSIRSLQSGLSSSQKRIGN